MVYSWLAVACREVGHYHKAAEQLHTALSMALDVRCVYPLMHSLPAAALLLVDHNEGARAVEVYEVALQFPHVANAQLFEDVMGKEIKEVAAGLPPEVVAEAKAQGRAADPWLVAAELAEEFGDLSSA